MLRNYVYMAGVDAEREKEAEEVEKEGGNVFSESPDTALLE